jgi:hypothetical protein
MAVDKSKERQRGKFTCLGVMPFLLLLRKQKMGEGTEGVH